MQYSYRFLSTDDPPYYAMMRTLSSPTGTAAPTHCSHRSISFIQKRNHHRRPGGTNDSPSWNDNATFPSRCKVPNVPILLSPPFQRSPHGISCIRARPHPLASSPPKPDLSLGLLECHPLQFRIDLPRLRIGAQWPAKEEYVRLRTVDGVVMPSPALLYADGTPFVLGQESSLGQRLRQFLRQDDVPIFIHVFFIIFTRPFQAAGTTMRDACVFVL